VFGEWFFTIALYQGGSAQVQRRDPVLYIDDPKAFTRNLKEKYIDAINRHQQGRIQLNIQGSEIPGKEQPV